MGVEPVVVGTIKADAPAAQSGLQVSNRVLAFNGETVRNSSELSAQIRDNKDAPANIMVERNGEQKQIQTQAKLDDDGVYRVGIGFSRGPSRRANKSVSGQPLLMPSMPISKLSD